MIACRVCLGPTDPGNSYHPACLKSLFGATRPITLDINTEKLHTAALAMVGRTSLSGVQKKISIGVSLDRTTLKVMAEGGGYILKPQTGVYPSIPENEHLTTCLAGLAGIETAPSGLVELTDGELAFIVRRFDRLRSGRKVAQEDFCQLAQRPPKDKYRGSAELCVRIVRRYASEPLIELRRLYRLMVFCWWTGNGDMHLKNFSLLTAEDGTVKLTPAYDLVSTHLVIPNDPLALSVGGKDRALARGDWLRLGDYCGLPRKVSQRVLGEQAAIVEEAISLIGHSYLPDDQKTAYEGLLRERATLLG